LARAGSFTALLAFAELLCSRELFSASDDDDADGDQVGEGGNPAAKSLLRISRFGFAPETLSSNGRLALASAVDEVDWGLEGLF